MPASSPQDLNDQTRRGVAFAVIAYMVWGCYALFYAQVTHISPLEVMAHRAFWSVPLAAAVLLLLGRTGDILPALRSPAVMGRLVFTTLLVAVNWGVFIWAIAVGRTIETSLGFYINPLVNVVVGYVLLGERFSRLQGIAIVIAAVAVTVQTIALGVFPWIAFLLAGCFAAYGFIRKTMDIGPSQGFLVETVMLSIGSIAVIWWLSGHDGLKFGASMSDTLWLIAGGPMTAAPLILFATAARMIRFSTIGLLQYIAPTGLFLTAVLIFGDEVGIWRWITFAMIWTALALYSVEALRQDRHKAAAGMPK